MFARIVKTAWPIMLSYIAVGLACGVLSAQAGMAWWMSAVLSLTIFTGSGQFMIANLWLSGVPPLSVAASVSAVSARFALYSASLAPYLKGASKAETLAVSGTLIEEGYGISLGKLAAGDDWGPVHATLLNVVLILTWTVATAAGTAVGSALSIPTAIAGFTCTSLFIYLLSSQRLSLGNAVAAVMAFIVVAAFKYVGLANVAVPVAAVAGVAVALVVGAFASGRGEGARDVR